MSKRNPDFAQCKRKFRIGKDEYYWCWLRKGHIGDCAALVDFKEMRKLIKSCEESK